MYSLLKELSLYCGSLIYTFKDYFSITFGVGIMCNKISKFMCAWGEFLAFNIQQKLAICN